MSPGVYPINFVEVEEPYSKCYKKKIDTLIKLL